MPHAISPSPSPQSALPSSVPLVVSDTRANDIAVVGLSFQFPNADSVDSLWDLMLSGHVAASTFPEDRLSSATYCGLDDADKTNVRARKAAFLQRDLGAFDAGFFGMNAEEASAADPQQRILLEVVYRALENAGVSMEKLDGSKTSVHVGAFGVDYMLSTARDPQRGAKYGATGQALSMLANRISTFFNLTGPSITLDTACSSSLVALDQACRCITQGESTMAVVAGCNIMLSPDYFLSLANLGLLGPEGICRSFDSRGNGYGRGEGFGVIILKSLTTAIQDGDTIRGVIRATATNQNGRTSLAQPDKFAQADLITSTYQRANLDTSRTFFVEAHGTGTAVGDPIEAMAIGSSLAVSRGRMNKSTSVASDDQGKLYVGSIKANIGHLEGASGIAGVIKTILVLERGLIPPIAGLEELNKSIDADFLQLKFPTTVQAWPCPGLRRASVNSFGFGGTNAHAIIDDAMNYLGEHGLSANHCTVSAIQAASHVEGGAANSYSQVSAGSARIWNGPDANCTIPFPALPRPMLFAWSAADSDVTTCMTGLYHDHIKQLYGQEVGVPNGFLEDLAFTLGQRRTLHSWRVGIVSSTIENLIEQLSHPKDPIKALQNPAACFVFTGQGAQWSGMGRELGSFPAFQDSIMASMTYLRGLGCDWDVLGMLLGDSCGNEKIDEPQFSQPLCTIVQIALVELLRTLGLHPATVIGHSSGEIAAAYAVGAISRESAWRLAFYRGLLSGGMIASHGAGNTQGAMMAVGASESTMLPLIELIHSRSPNGTLVVACINSPQNVTVSGDVPLIHSLQACLEEKQIFNRILKVPVAYHSPHMHHISQLYQALVGKLEAGSSPPRYAGMISSVTGGVISHNQLQRSDYWVKNLVSQVKFSDAVTAVCDHTTTRARNKLDLSHRDKAQISDFIEIGPHSALGGPIRETLASHNNSSMNYAPTLVRGKGPMKSLLEMVAQMHCRGHGVDLSVVNDSGHETRVSLSTLPEYPFNHSKVYWDENYISKQMRFPPFGYTQFLGAPVADWNPLEPRWRNTLNVSSIEWLKDHKINGSILFPGAGMLVMAIEAITLTATTQPIAAYDIKDITFLTALTIPSDDNGVDVHFVLRPAQDSTAKGGAWASFTLFKVDGTNFIEICRGSIRAVPVSQSSHALDSEAENQARYVANLISRVDRSRIVDISGQDLYSNLEAAGAYYGPVFQRIQRLCRDREGTTSAELRIFSSESKEPTDTPTVIHPSTLDGMFHTINSPMAASPGDARSTWIPSYVSKIWISSSGLRDQCTEGNLHAFSSTQKRSARSTMSSIRVVDTLATSQLIRAEGVECTLVSNDADVGASSAEARPVRKLCYDLQYLPDLSLLSNDQISDYCHEDIRTDPDPTEFLRLLKLFILTSTARIIDSVSLTDLPKEPAHIARQYDWLKSQLERARNHAPAGLPQNWLDYALDANYNTLCDDLAATGELGQIYVQFSKSATDVLLGKADPLELLTQNDMLKNYYELFQGDAKFFQPMKKYIDALAHKNPALRILEVGAGTGATTKYVLDTLVKDSSTGPCSRFAQYEFTDISPSFLEKASDDFSKVKKMNFRLFDTERDSASQGYEENSYDLIIASNVLHATMSLQDTLDNLRRLLRDGGKLVIIEITDPRSMIAHSIFGYLPGWWRSIDPWRQEGPCASLDQWGTVLENAGFTGVDWASNDFSLDENHFTTMFVSSRKPTKEMPIENCLSHKSLIELVTGWDQTLQSDLCENVVLELQNIGACHSRTTSFSDLAAQDNVEDKIIVVVESHECLSLEDMDTTQYNWLCRTLSRANAVLWLAVPSPATEVSRMALVNGLARTLRQERVGLVFSTVCLEGSSTSTALSQSLNRSLNQFLLGTKSKVYEPELIQLGNTLLIPRVYESDFMNRQISELSSLSIERQVPFNERNIKLKVRQPGLLETLYFEEAPMNSPLGPGEIEVEVKAVGANFKDCLVALGRVFEDSIGGECAGVVVATGTNCHLQIGDEVFLLARDAFQRRVRSQEQLATKIPKGLSFTEASVLAINFVTAYHSLITIARLQPGESILIHCGAGGTGQAAIQIAQYSGAEIYTTVGSPEKRELLINQYNIPPHNILNSRDLSFAQGIKRLTGERGVDVVLNSLAGDALIASWECIAPHGRFVEIGKWDIFSHNQLPMYQFANNVSFSAVDIGALNQQKSSEVQRTLLAIVDLIEKGAIRGPSPLKTFPISEVEMAFRYLQSGSNAGKVAVEIDPDDIVPAHINPQLSWKISPNHTFVIAGGLGGQGRSIATWMQEKGAKHLVLLSRSGAQNERASALVESLRAKGVNVYCPPCNIADSSSLHAVMEHCRSNMPPIRGCIQAAMDVQDSLFERMTHDQWHASLQPKLAGTWNLHVQLPQDLDFFIMFSSVAGIIGATGQSNYAAGNVFQDELAKLRLSQRQKAVSLNLSTLIDDGWASENKEWLKQYVNIKQLMLMYRQEVHALLDYYCNPATPIDIRRPQVVMGLEIPAEIAARGIEYADWMKDPMFGNMHQLSTSADTQHSSDLKKGDGQQDLAALIAQSATLAEAADTVTQGFMTKLGRILSIAPDDMDANMPLHTYGVDSLIAVELRNWFMKSVKVDVTVFQILGGASATGLGQSVAEQLRS